MRGIHALCGEPVRLTAEGVAPRIIRIGCIDALDDMVECECSILKGLDVVFLYLGL